MKAAVRTGYRDQQPAATATTELAPASRATPHVSGGGDRADQGERGRDAIAVGPSRP